MTKKRRLAISQSRSASAILATRDLDPAHASQYSGLTADSFEVTLIENDSSGELLTLNNYIVDEDLMAFDAEWQPESPRTVGVHVLQLAFPSKQHVFVVQLCALREPHLTSLKTSFQRRARKIVGWGATEDIHRLSNIFSLDWQRKIFDIQTVAGILMKETEADAGIRGQFGQSPSMFRKLQDAVDHFLGISLSKDSSVTCSDWSAPHLSSEQVRYAATDAWLTALLYLRLASLPEALALFERRWGPQGQRTFDEEMQLRQRQAEKDRARLRQQPRLALSRSRSR